MLLPLRTILATLLNISRILQPYSSLALNHNTIIFYPQYSFFIFFIFLMFYLFLRERDRDRDRAWVGEGQSERGTQNPKHSRLWAVSAETERGLNSQSVGSWLEPKSEAQLTEPPRRPYPQHSLMSLIKSTTEIFIYKLFINIVITKQLANYNYLPTYLLAYISLRNQL